MKTLLRHRGLGGLFFAQSQVAFTDNAAKLVLIGLVQMLLPADAASRSAGLIALLLVSPFFLFAPLVGWMSDRFSKHSVLAGSLWLQAAIMGVMMLAASWQILPVAIAGLFFLGIQSAIMSPARRGMVKELAGDNVPQVVGVFGGQYLVPLGAFLVSKTPESERGRILAASSMLSSLAGVGAVAIHWLIAGHLPTSAQFVVMAAIFILAAGVSLTLLKRDVLQSIALLLSRAHYSVKAAGSLPEEGGALIVCNHVSYVDTIILSLASRRPIRFLSYEGFFSTPVLGSILRCFGAIPVSDKRAGDAIRKAAEHIRAGELVCIFPEGQLTRTGCLMELKGGFSLIARRAECPVIVAHLDGLWGSIFSFEGGRYFTKCPKSICRRATVSFSKPMSYGISVEEVRAAMLELGAAAFADRSTKHDLASTLTKSLKADALRIVLQDGTRPMRGIEVLAASKLLAKKWKNLPGHRIGIILPPGAGGTIANTAILLAGKVPVNINPLLSEETAARCLENAGIRTIITAGAIRKKLARFPWPAHVVLVEDAISRLSKAEKIRAMITSLALPAKPIAKHNEEALLLFTSGTSGMPSMVSLTHGNILANITQVRETGFIKDQDRLLSALPLFHSFGLSMGLFLPLIARRPLITAPSPLETDAITDAARASSPTLLLATPTFLRHYVKRIAPDVFSTLRMAVTGAERLPAETAAAFRERFACEVAEGYGLTETSPVAAINVANPGRGLGADSIQLGWRDGSVGRLLPGVAMRLLDPETGETCANEGILALRGANVITAYADGSNTEKFQNGWFITGDIVRIDTEGFVFIQGRKSRFSKIAGEMVSHASIEEAIAKVMSSSTEADCVIGRPSPEKGEELVLLTTRHITCEEIRRKLQGLVPNLWVPRQIITLEKLPCLASGKLDLAACQKLVLN